MPRRPSQPLPPAASKADLKAEERPRPTEDGNIVVDLETGEYRLKSKDEHGKFHLNHHATCPHLQHQGGEGNAT